MAIVLKNNLYLTAPPSAAAQLVAPVEQLVGNQNEQGSIPTVRTVHQYVKRVFFDANSARNRRDDIAKFKDLEMAKGVKSVNEMSGHLEGFANFITLCGHGAPGIQGLGSGATEKNYQKGYDICVDQLADIEGTISELHRFLCPSNQSRPWPAPVLFLAGCEVGCGPSGTKLLKQLSLKMPNVLIIASEDPLTYKQYSTVVKINKLRKGNPSQLPIEFKFALNGSRIKMENLDAYTGHDSSLLECELTQYSR
ncbi:MAG: hypothetical protein JSR93_03185 [Verrucomicrobia bacterium]|nr:hypothetical protein [Verrucomicrobiota bacterium]